MNKTISAGDWHSLGLRADGKVIGWGDNEYGQIKSPDEKFIAIAVGYQHSLGLRADGKVFGWGAKYAGQINCPDEPFVAIASCRYHFLGLRADGKVFGWGVNRHGEVNCPVEKIALPYDFLGRLNKNVKVLCRMPKYIKMEILEDYTEWEFRDLYYL